MYINHIFVEAAESEIDARVTDSTTCGPRENLIDLDDICLTSSDEYIIFGYDEDNAYVRFMYIYLCTYELYHRVGVPSQQIFFI